MRSLLSVPADQEDLVLRAQASGPDVLILDLAAAADPMAAGARRAAVDAIRAHRNSSSGGRVFIRVHAPETSLVLSDLDIVMTAAPDGIVLAACAGKADMRLLDARIALREALHDIEDGTTPIVAELSASAIVLGGAAELRDAGPRLIGLIPCDMDWGDRSSPVHQPRAGDGQGLARGVLLMAAQAARLPAFERSGATADPVAFETQCRAARLSGFSGMITADPDKVATINAVFGEALPDRG